jgi:two-component system response regulator AtoC
MMLGSVTDRVRPGSRVASGDIVPERHILIIDDEPALSELLAYRLRKEGYLVQTAEDAKSGRATLEADFDGVILLDLRLPDADGIALVAPFIALNPNNRIIIMTAHGSIDHAIEATQKGAYDFVTKTDDLPAGIVVAVKNAFRDRDITNRVTSLEAQVGGRHQFDSIVARSPTMLTLFERLHHVVDSRVTVLIQGDSGTGKELVARALHYEGPRRLGPFVALNCAGIPENLLESELFGHERGSFTGAIATKRGRFELADGGTLFLDEIGEMPFHLQAKILRVLQERKVERVGSARARPIDVRIVSATHRDLMAMVQENAFREDLYYRLAVFPVVLPPLRDREGDIALLAHHFLERACTEEGKTQMTISSAAMRMLERYLYPGNVRELENIISHAVVVAQGTQISISDLPISVLDAVRRLVSDAAEASEHVAAGTLDQTFEALFQSLDELPPLEGVESALIARALKLADGNVVAAARALGMSRATFYRRIEKLGGRDLLMA